VTGLGWEEIDLVNGVWTVPAYRMKTGRDHRVPLCPRAQAIVREMAGGKRGAFVFPGSKSDAPLSEMALELQLRRMNAKPYTVHGFRSSFRDWVGETTSFPRELAEAALSHTVGNLVERSYRRGDALQRRREMMDAWEDFLNN
jgi:integrase